MDAAKARDRGGEERPTSVCVRFRPMVGRESGRKCARAAAAGGQVAMLDVKGAESSVFAFDKVRWMCCERLDDR